MSIIRTPLETKSHWLRWGLIALGSVFVVAIVTLSLSGLLPWAGPAKPVQRELVYTVPKGTLTSVGLGVKSTVLPNEVELTVGGLDTLVIENEDLYPISVGGVLLHPGQSFRQQFTRPGTYELACSVHAADRIRVIVHPAGTY